MGSDAGLEDREGEPCGLHRVVAVGVRRIAGERDRVTGLEHHVLPIDDDRHLTLLDLDQLLGTDGVRFALVTLAWFQNPVPELEDVWRRGASHEDAASPGLSRPQDSTI